MTSVKMAEMRLTEGFGFGTNGKKMRVEMMSLLRIRPLTENVELVYVLSTTVVLAFYKERFYD